MEQHIKNNVSDITYKSELTLDNFPLINNWKLSRVKFAQTTYVHCRCVSCGLI